MKVNFDAERVGLLLGIVKEAAQHGQALQPVLDAANAELTEINADVADQLNDARIARDEEIAKDQAEKQHELQLAAEEQAEAQGLPKPEIKAGPSQVDASVTTFAPPAQIAVPGVVMDAPEPTPVTPAIPPPGSAAGDVPVTLPQPHEEVPEGGSAPAPSLAPAPAKEGITDPGAVAPAAGDPRSPSAPSAPASTAPVTPVGPGSSTPQSPNPTPDNAARAESLSDSTPPSAAAAPPVTTTPAADPAAPRRI